jgi:tRNA threonylcarbamoyladenosine biosynthesis protein TsaE
VALSIFKGRELTWASLEDTDAFAKEMAAEIEHGDVLLLKGPVGAGKTTFMGFLLKALGVSEPAQSPSYAIERIYDCAQGEIHHFDLYRLDSNAAFESLDPWETLGEVFFSVIEWPDALSLKWPEEWVRMDITPLSETTRGVKCGP